MKNTRRIVVIGVGNPDRGDDAVGRVVARRVSATLPPAVAVIERGGSATEVMDALAGVDAAIIVDAIVSGADPGQIHRFDAHAAPLPAHRTGGSTHGMGVAQAIELSRALGTLPAEVVVFGVEASTFDMGDMSAEVSTVVDRLTQQVIDEAVSMTGGMRDA